MKKQNYTEFKSSILNNVNLSTSVRMGPKVFGKNICQAKIAQVSRPLLQLKEWFGYFACYFKRSVFLFVW